MLAGLRSSSRLPLPRVRRGRLYRERSVQGNGLLIGQELLQHLDRTADPQQRVPQGRLLTLNVLELALAGRVLPTKLREPHLDLRFQASSNVYLCRPTGAWWGRHRVSPNLLRYTSTCTTSRRGRA